MKDKLVYSSEIYAFDIETTTYQHIVSHYLSNFQHINFKYKNKGKDEIIKNCSIPTFCRTADDINNYLENLNATAGEHGKTVIIYVHNLAYEFDYLIKNIPFVYNNFKNESSLFLKTRIPLFIRCKNIEFRCSFKLLNKSLSALGKNLGYQKLEIDYATQYFEFSTLPDIEYNYNQRDVTLTLLAVLQECNNWEYIKTVKDIPYTSTGFTRKNNKVINTKEDIQIWGGMCNYQRNFTKEHIDFLESVYSGGYTHSNAFYTARAVGKCCSMDIVSSYPHTILHRQYPHFFEEYTGKHKLQALEKYIRMNEDNYIDKIKNYTKPFSKSFLCSIKLVNVKAKILKNKNLILPISLSKCFNFSKVEVDNGRIFSAGMIEINCNEIDYYIFSRFYDFDLVGCSRLFYTNFHKPLPPFLLNATRQYLDEKSTLKNIIKQFEEEKEITVNMFYNERKKDYIFPLEQCVTISKIKDRKEMDLLLNDNYRASKNRLNAQYGINVQKLLNDDIEYDVENDEYIVTPEQHILAKVLYRDFTKGLYITAYSRLTLFMYALYLINNTNAVLIYSDTDSWKVVGDLKAIHNCNTEYNKLINSIIHNDEDYYVGNFDYECEYDNFATLGCKKYITLENGSIHSTIAGLNKHNASKAYTELYHFFGDDFNMLCKIAFTPNTIITPDVSGKLITKYNSNKYSINVTDSNGKSGIINGTNMVELCGSDFILMNLSKSLVSYYIHYLERLQGRQFNPLGTEIYKDSKGKVSYRYIENWRERIVITRNKIQEGWL